MHIVAFTLILRLLSADTVVFTIIPQCFQNHSGIVEYGYWTFYNDSGFLECGYSCVYNHSRCFCNDSHILERRYPFVFTAFLAFLDADTAVLQWVWPSEAQIPSCLL